MKPNGTWMRQNSWKMTIAMPAGMAISTFLLNFKRSDPAFTNWPSGLLDLLVTIQGYSHWLLGITLLVWFVWQWRLKSAKNWVTVKSLLGFMRDKVFQEQDGEPKNHHRVTLFVFTRYRWRYGSIKQSLLRLFIDNEQSGWLVPICRAGHLTQKSHAVFEVNDSGHYQGVCGKAWATCQVHRIGGLPKVTGSSAPSVLDSYARATECTKESIRSRISMGGSDKDGSVIPRSIGAIPIVTDNSSAPKYVLVVDSRKGDGVPEDIGSHYTVVTQLLDQLLGESK